MTAESQGWDEDEFVGFPLDTHDFMESVGELTSVFSLPRQEEFDDDYESPYSGDDAESVEDYELPNDDVANDYEPPPSQPSEDLKVCPSLPIGDNDYIGN